MQLHSNHLAITNNIKVLRSFKRFSQSGAYNWGGSYIKSYDFGGVAYNRGGTYFRAGLQSRAYGIKIGLLLICE